jgi:glycosyltransferase involved in cell wall biosynthesis
VKLAVVLSLFPSADEAFILRELASLERTGALLRIYSIRNPRAVPLHAQAARLKAATRYSPFLWSAPLWSANLALLLTRPLLYLRLLFTVFRETWRSFPFLWRSLAVFPKAVRWAVELKSRPVDRIHAHWATHPSTAAWLMSEITGIPFSITAHAHDIYLDQAMLPFKLRAATAVLTCTRQNMDFLRHLAPDLPPGRIRLSYHGVDLEAYRPASRPPRAFRALAVGTLLPRKGFDTLLEACAILERDGTAVECLVVGDGPLRAELENHARDLGLKGARFLGRRSQEELPEIYRSASVLVMPAVCREPGGRGPAAADKIHFGIPNVILEAMACGLPVITTPLPAVREVLREGENGLLVPERDAPALAGALRRLAADPVRRTSMGKRALDCIRSRFDLSMTCAEVAEVLSAGTRRRYVELGF